jgi:hypothetical protein
MRGGNGRLIEVAHPGSNPVLDSFAKSYQRGRKDQDASENYSESGAEVQVLCLPNREVVGIGRRVGASYRDSCPSEQQGNLLWL